MDNNHAPAGSPRIAAAFLQSLAASPGWLKQGSEPVPSVEVPADFLGVNVAPSEDPSVNDYTLERLAELGLRCVRMDFTYTSAAGPAGDYLERLLGEGFEVLLNLFPPLEEAASLHLTEQARQRWGEFLTSTFQRYRERVPLFEIGNTPNRGRWSGFSAQSFVAAWAVARERAALQDVDLVGPNVSDFEPLYNSAFLRLVAGDGRPRIHSDNLFVERVVEPEAYDHRVLGDWATDLVKLNLIKKARVLESIGQRAGCESLFCTYTCWTMKRLSRRAAWPEQKQVDYLIRYLLLAAASGALRRVYWGPLACSRDGLIDDRATDYPEIDQVSFYERVRGNLADFRITPGFYALRETVARLSGARCRTLVHQVGGLSVFALEREAERTLLVAWCRDGQSHPLASLLPEELLAAADFRSGTGQRLPRPAVVNESPLLIELAAGHRPPELGATQLPCPGEPATVHLASPEQVSIAHTGERWRGACMLRAEQQPQDLDLAATLEPEQIPGLPETRVMRDVRNRLWNVVDPRGRDGEVTIKLNRVKGFKRLSYRFRPSKGRRHWNNACLMLRRGIATPLPVAFYEHREQAGIRDSWYLCEFIPQAFSCREVYAAFRDGAGEYRGLAKSAWFELLAGFVCNMHNKQIVHRDLSSGNLLLQQLEDGTIRPRLIDIGRAWIWDGPGSRVTPRQRLLDLMRICYKLSWQDREHFVACYEDHFGRTLGRWWRLPFHYYDNKQRLKKAIKGKRKRTPRPSQPPASRDGEGNL